MAAASPCWARSFSAARLLSGELGSTYVARHFPGGAIDHLLVAGPAAGAFGQASTPPVSGRRWQGPDHRRVLTTGSRTAGPDL